MIRGDNIVAGYFVTGDYSCIGASSCENAARGGGRVTIGSGSCTEINACYTVWGGPKDFTVGDGSCNNVAGVCACLENGDIVPDNSCNSFGDDQCCADSGNKGSIFSPF